MNLEELHDEWESKDSIIDFSRLQYESLNIYKKHAKYLRELNHTNLELSQSEEDLKQIRRNCWYKYNGLDEKNPFNITLSKKDDLNLFIESDDEYRNKQAQVTYFKEKVVFLEHVMKAISSMSFTIKNAIDYIKIENGQY